MSESDNDDIKLVKIIARRGRGRPALRALEEKKRMKREYDRKYHAERYKNDPEYKKNKKLRNTLKQKIMKVNE
jgi:hypothetical protein